ncbi:MAG: hypothetical protein FWD16_07565 [Clostridia bacterium]|nr:hypothetical protein [Clostridia bacterium]
MKKTFIILVAAALALLLCACSVATNRPTASPGASQSPNTPKPAVTGAITDDDPWLQLEGYIKLEQNILYYEGYTLAGDPGDGLTPRQGAELALKSLVTDELRGLITPTVCIFISFDNLEMLDDTECYMYNISVGTADERQLGQEENKLLAVVDYQAGTAFLFDDWRDSGRGDVVDDDVPHWWGTYVGDGFSISIVNFNGTSFRFVVSNLSNGEYFLEGLAVLDPENDHQATHGTGTEFIGLFLNEGDSSIDFQSSESSEWAHLRGTYEQV